MFYSLSSFFIFFHHSLLSRCGATAAVAAAPPQNCSEFFFIASHGNCVAPCRSFGGGIVEYGERIKVDALNFMIHLCEIKRLKMILFRFVIFCFSFLFFIYFIFFLFAIKMLQVSCAHRRGARCISAAMRTSLFIVNRTRKKKNKMEMKEKR